MVNFARGNVMMLRGIITAITRRFAVIVVTRPRLVQQKAFDPPVVGCSWQWAA